MSSSPNLIQVGAVVDLGQYKAGMAEAAATTESTMSEMSSSFERHGEKSQAAMHAMGLSAEATGITINRHLRSVINELPILSKAFELAFPVFAGLAMIDVIKRVGEKLGELISDTFIFTDAMKEEEKGIKTTNDTLAAYAARIKAIGREMQIAAESTAEGKEKLRLKFTLEDLGGDPAALRAKLKESLAELRKAQNEAAEISKGNAKFDWGPALQNVNEQTDEANKKISDLSDKVNHFSQALALAEAEAKRTAQAIKHDLASEYEALSGKVQRASEEVKRAQAELSRSQNHLDEDMFREFKAAQDAQVKAAIEGVDRRVKAMLKEFEEEKQATDEGLKGQIEAAKQAIEVRQQLIEQDFLRGKINQQQEIAAIAAEKEKEIQLERLTQQKRWALWDGDVKKQQQVQNEINKLVAQAELTQTKAVTDGLKAQEQQYKNVFSTIGNSFKTEILGMLEGTQSVSQAFLKMYQTLIGSLANYIAQKAEKKAEEWAIDKLFHIHSVTAETGAAAGKAMAAAYASVMSALPFPVNVATAPGVAAASGVQATAFGLSGLASFDIGSNYVPMTGLALIHKGEQIIPANAQGPGYSGNHFHLHFGVNAIDAEGVRGHLRKHRREYSDMFFSEAKKKGFGT